MSSSDEVPTVGSLRELSENLTRDTVRSLLSPKGRAFLVAWINETADLDGCLSIESWCTRVSNSKDSVSVLLADAVAPIIERLDSARKEIVALTPRTVSSILPGVLADIDIDIDEDSPIHRVAGDGGVAAVVALVGSALLQGNRYRTGDIDLRVAVNNVVSETSVANLLAAIGSRVVSALRLGARTSAILTALLVPILEASLSVILGWVFSTFFGDVSAIREARHLHTSYLEVASAVQGQLAPRLRQLSQAGLLVDKLSSIDDYESAQDDMIEDAILHLRHIYDAHPSQIIEATGITHEAVQTTLGRTVYDILEENLTSASVKSLVARYGVRPDQNPEFVQRYASVERLRWLQEVVRDEYWRYVAQQSERPDADDLAEDVVLRFGGSEDPVRRDVFVVLIEFLSKLEDSRPQKVDPIRVEHRTGDFTFYVRATDFVEYMRFTTAIEKLEWCWGPTPSDRTSRIPSEVWHKKEKGERSAVTISSLSQFPSDDRPFNPQYKSGMYTGILNGKMRLFRFFMESGGDCPAHYICVPATSDDPESQLVKLKKSLSVRHPEFVIHPHRWMSLSHVDVSYFVESEGDRATFVMMGFHTMPMDSYTATYRVSHPREPGKYQYVFVEGYFQSIEVARQAFSATSGSAHVVGVRPGSVLLNEGLREALRNPERRKFWVVQHHLMSCLADGLLLLNDLSDQDEQQIARMAMMGGLALWWWGFTGRVRTELIQNLRDKQVQQALRVELMQTLLALQRVHILNHKFFENTPLRLLAEQEAQDLEGAEGQMP